MSVLHAVASSPADRSKLAIGQATEALRAGNLIEAQRLLRERVVAHPNDGGALAMLAEIALDQNRFEDATVLLRRASVADPSPRRRLALVHHLLQAIGADAALAEVAALPPSLRLSFDVLTIEAAALGTLGMHGRQIAIYQRLATQQPGNAILWMCLGNAYKTVGRTDDAILALRKAIDARSTYGEAYWTLANFKSFTFTERDIAAMKRALKRKLSPEDELHFHFSLGKANEDRKLYEPSFRHYAAGNRLRASTFSPAAQYATAFVGGAIATFREPLFDRHRGHGCKARDPIFVLGLHRSGSTLVEQILASHPLIEGTTEITVMQQLWDRLGRVGQRHGRGTFQQIMHLDGGEIEAIGAEYLERTRAFRLSDRPYFVDKLPANWMNLGLIRLALPNARIVDARRHPMACGFSNFKQHYASGVAFAYSLESIGTFYRDYWRFMRHFNQVQPGAVHRIINERLIDDPEGEVRRLLDYLGLPFDPACLQFHSNRRAVRTPSAEQVRRPINRDGVGAWRHYEPWLGPLKSALGEALDSWDSE